MFHRTSLLTLVLTAVLFTAGALVAAPQTAQAAGPCLLTGQALVNAHVAGTVFTDLAGPSKAGQGKMTVRNSSDCTVQETLASYRSTNARPPVNQQLFSLTYASIAPHSTQDVAVSIPDCTFQIDAYTGLAPRTNQVNVSQYQVLYGEIVDRGHFCDVPNTTPTPTPTPVITPTPTANPTPCVLDGQNLINAHMAGSVFTDLAGANKAGKGEVTIRNNSDCEVRETLGSWRSTNARPPVNQKLIEIKHLTIAPHSTITDHVATVPCTYQIDAFAGFAPAADQTNISQYPIIYGEVVDYGRFCDSTTPTPTPTGTVTPTPTPTSGPCVLDGQNLINAHFDGRVFTDLAGANKAGKGEITIRNNSGCEVHETFGSYRSTNARPPVNQKVFDVQYLTVPAGATQTFHIGIPSNCTYQIDAFAGFAPKNDQVDINQYPIIYGEVVDYGHFCDATTPTPTPTPTPNPHHGGRNGSGNNTNNNNNPVNVINNINNTSNSASNSSTGEIHVSTGDVKNSANGNTVSIGNQARVLGTSTVKYIPYASYNGTPVSVPITAKTGPEGMLAFATLSTGSGLLWTLKRLLAK